MRVVRDWRSQAARAHADGHLCTGAAEAPNSQRDADPQRHLPRERRECGVDDVDGRTERIEGVWWLGSDPHRRIAGILTRSSAGNGVLDLEGVLLPHDGSRDDWAQAALIRGSWGTSINEITLIDCFETRRRNLDGSLPAPRSQRVAVRYALLHVAIDDPDPLVSSAWTRLDVLDAWSHRGQFSDSAPLESQPEGGYSQTVTFAWPASLKSRTSVGTVELTTPPMPSGYTYPGIVERYECRSYLNVSLEPAIRLSELFPQVLSPLRAFFALSTDSEPTFTQINLTLPDGRSAFHPQATLWCTSEVLDQDHTARPFTEDEAAAVVRQGYLTVRRIEDTFGDVLRRWFEVYPRVEDALGSLASAADNSRGRWVTDLFQSAAFGTEAMFRAIGLRPTGLPPEQRNDISDRLRGALTDEERKLDWLISRIKYVAGPTYEDRLDQLVSLCPEGLCEAAGPDFVKRVKHARNFFAHPEDATRRPSNDELHRLASLLVLVLVCQLLRELGLDEATISDCVLYSDRFYELRRRGAIAVSRESGEERFVAVPA